MTRRSVYGAALVAFLAGMLTLRPYVPKCSCTKLTGVPYSLRDDPHQHNSPQMDKLG